MKTIHYSENLLLTDFAQKKVVEIIKILNGLNCGTAKNILAAAWEAAESTGVITYPIDSKPLIDDK